MRYHHHHWLKSFSVDLHKITRPLNPNHPQIQLYLDGDFDQLVGLRIEIVHFRNFDDESLATSTVQVQRLGGDEDVLAVEDHRVLNFKKMTATASMDATSAIDRNFQP